MKNKQLKRNNLTLGKIIILLTFSSFLINSCRKDEKNTQQTDLTPDISMARSWYESTYPTTTDGNRKATSALRTKGTYIDLSQFIKPDWQHPVSYVKQSKGVIELPIDPGKKINSTLKNIVNNNTYADKANSRSSFIFLKDGNGYKAYIMTIIADASYLKNNLSKLANNTYRKHDADFSGLVLYFTPKGKYLNGYRYTNGKLITASATKNTQTTAIKNNNLKVNKAEPVCIDWYWDTYVDGELVSEEYLYTTCSGGDDTGGGGGGGATPPPPCTPSGGGAVESGGKLSVNKVAPQPQPIGDDPGYPPPVDNPDPCTPGGGNTSEPDFGEDDPSQCLNCRITDANFTDYLDYITEQGYQPGDPIARTLVVNGVEYPGQMTPIYDSNGDYVATYFTPNTTSGPFEAGTEYRVGTDADGNPTSSPVTNNGFDLGSIAPEVGPGNTVSYSPSTGGGGGSPLTYNQRVALEASDNSRILNLLKQEDAADDAVANPCHGTGRSGNVQWPGTLEHWLIQADYIASNPAALKEYFIPGSSGRINGNPGYADIVNSATNEMFEIKPNNLAGQNAGAAEIQLYVSQGNLLCPPPGGGSWRAGTGYSTRLLLDPRNPANLIEATLNANGVIVYESKARTTQPQPAPVPLPQNLTDKLKKLLRAVSLSPLTMQQQILTFLRQNPAIVPYLKSAAAAIIIATVIEDIVTEGVGIADDWESFVVARTLWRISNQIVLY